MDSQSDRTATHDDIEGLLAAGLLTPESHKRAAEILSEPADSAIWVRYGRWALLGLGVLQILAGIIFFFDSVFYNQIKYIQSPVSGACGGLSFRLQIRGKLNL